MMAEICEADVTAILGDADELVLRELIRTKATVLDLRAALAFTKGPAAVDTNIYQTLPGQMRRLVDLLSVGLDDALSIDDARR